MPAGLRSLARSVAPRATGALIAPPALAAGRARTSGRGWSRCTPSSAPVPAGFAPGHSGATTAPAAGLGPERVGAGEASAVVAEGILRFRG